MNDGSYDKRSEAKRKLWGKLTIEERLLITDQFYLTARDIIIDNAPKNLSENQLKRYIYEKLHNEPAPKGLWD